MQEGEVGHLPAKAFRKSEVCNFCNNVWLYGRCHVSVLPKKLPGRKMKKIIHKQELAQTLRPFEKKLFEKYKKEKDNKLVRVLVASLERIHTMTIFCKLLLNLNNKYL